MNKTVLVLDPRPGVRARTMQMLEQLEVEAVAEPSATHALQQLLQDEPAGLVVSPQLNTLSGEGLLALARSFRPKIETVVIEHPDQDRGPLENFVRRVKARLQGK